MYPVIVKPGIDYDLAALGRSSTFSRRNPALERLLTFILEPLVTQDEIPISRAPNLAKALVVYMARKQLLISGPALCGIAPEAQAFGLRSQKRVSQEGIKRVGSLYSTSTLSIQAPTVSIRTVLHSI